MQGDQEEFSASLQKVAGNLLNRELLKEFVERFGVRVIVGAGLLATKDKEVYARAERTIKQWIRDPELWQSFVFSRDLNDQDVLKALMVHPQPHVRSIVAECIDIHAYEVVSAIESESSDEKQQTYLTVLVHLLSDLETEVALKILRALKKILRQSQSLGVLAHKFWFESITKGIKNEDSVVSLRFMELIVAMSNASDVLHKHLVETGLLDAAIALYTTDDILVKLNAVEIFAGFGEKQHNAAYLAGHGIMKSILAEAFNPNEDLYVRKYSLLLVVKMIGNSALKLTENLAKDISAVIGQLINSKAQEQISSAFEIIQFLSIRQDGLNVVLRDRKSLKVFAEYATSNRVELRKKCINSFTHMLLSSKTNPKNANTILHLLISIAQPSSVLSVESFTEQPDRLDLISESLKQIEANLFSPFEDIELDYIHLLFECFSYETVCESYVAMSRSIEYLASHFAKNKLIFDLKMQLREKIVHVAKKQEKSSKLYAAFLDSYFKELENKKSAASASQSEMSYDTATL